MSKKIAETAEYTDQFISLFGNVPTLPPSFKDLSQSTVPNLYGAISNDFYNHAGCPADYTIQRIQVLSNTITWNRYQTEKRLRRRQEYERQLIICSTANATRAANQKNNTSADANPITRAAPSLTDVLSTTIPPHSMEAKELYRDELLFHGTLKTNLPSILLNGLDPRLSNRQRRNYGAGTYFSDSIEKCMQYVDPQTEIEQEYCVLVCAVLLGRVLVEPDDREAMALQAQSYFLPEGYDSAVVNNFRKEWVVFDKAQILPLCAIHFKATNDPGSYFRLSRTTNLAQLGQNLTTISVPVLSLVPAPPPQPPASTAPSEPSIPADAEFIDANAIDSESEHPLLTDWRKPNPEMASMLESLFNIPPDSCKVRLYFEGKRSDPLFKTSLFPVSATNKLWIISCRARFVNGPITLSDETLMLLKEVAADLKELADSQKKTYESIKDLRAIQQQAINTQLLQIPEPERLLALWMAVFPDLDSMRKSIKESHGEEYSKQHPYTNSRLDNTIMTHCNQEIQVMEERYMEEIIFHASASGNACPWTLEQVALGLEAAGEHSQLEELETADERRKAAGESRLEEELATQRAFALRQVVYLGPGYIEVLEETLRSYHRSAARAQVETQGKLTTSAQPQQQQEQQQWILKWVKHKLLLRTLPYRYQILLEMDVIARSFAMRTSSNEFKALLTAALTTNSTNLLLHVNEKFIGIFRTLTSSVPSSVPFQPHLQWWDIVPMALFQAQMPASRYWPVNPRTRLPARSFYQLTDYVEWIFNKAYPMTKATETPRRIATGTTNVWDTIDPWIRPAIQGLSSRSGTLLFNRVQRQAEVDTLGGDMLDCLLLKLPLGTLLPPSLPANHKWRFAYEACPICTDPLLAVSKDFSRRRSARFQASDSDRRIVQLHECRHCFHEECIKTWFLEKDTILKCPLCNTCAGVAASTAANSATSSRCPSAAGANSSSGSSVRRAMKLGPMPDAMMTYMFDPKLCCYLAYFYIPEHTITVPRAATSRPPPTSSSGRSEPDFNMDVDTNEEEPTTEKITVQAECRNVVIPFSTRLGPILLIRLICAFYYGHFLKVGESVSRGVGNVVVWNGIHVRTAISGAYGFPAPDYEQSCWAEIDLKGVAVGLEELLLLPLEREGGGVTRVRLRAAEDRGAVLDRVFAHAPPHMFS